MRRIAAFALALVVTATAGCAGSRGSMAPVSFRTSTAQFAEGDSIVVDEVLGNGGRFGVGGTYIVRGRYALASRDTATLAFYATAPPPSATTEEESHMISVTKGTGTFEVKNTVIAKSWPHVSFYPAGGGESFGGVYFGRGAWLKPEGK